MHSQVIRHDDPIWSAIYQPNGFNCRCRVIALSEAAVRRRGLAVVSSEGRMFKETVETGTDKRTGEIRTATVTGVRLTTPKANPSPSEPTPASTTPQAQA
ncbi:hypothetical protein [Pseudomonas silensiensis]|uniref:hypothetical protein n=1 Tax=Pseudomonas silensiensis TaxID=2991049 RepID=UPI003D1C075D